jgi:uncharacterized protein (DUF58 family)
MGPAVTAVFAPATAWACFILDAALVLAIAVDFSRAKRASEWTVARSVEAVLSVGHVSSVVLEIALKSSHVGPTRVLVRDDVPRGIEARGDVATLLIAGRTTLRYQIEPHARGDHHFECVFLRVEGPWGFCARQFELPCPTRVKVFPDLNALSRDALQLTLAHEGTARRRVRQKIEGSEFDSLREYRPGDDRRTIDWKATARRHRAMVRVHRPERNQNVLLLIDCGRHMAGSLEGRPKLDHAVDAALKLTQVSLQQGDHVGVLVFARSTKAWLPAKKGIDHLQAIAHLLYRIEGSMDESDYGLALNAALAQSTRRSLVIVLTDLLDSDASEVLLKRTARLPPRHLPLIASMRDENVHALARSSPRTLFDAHRRRVATVLEADIASTVARLREAGARVVRSSPDRFGPAVVNAYLDIKARGLL